jgi:hypothetical protein
VDVEGEGLVVCSGNATVSRSVMMRIVVIVPRGRVIRFRDWKLLISWETMVGRRVHLPEYKASVLRSVVRD